MNALDSVSLANQAQNPIDRQIQSQLGSLPLDVLSKIFDELDNNQKLRMRRVCRRFNKVLEATPQAIINTRLIAVKTWLRILC